jgi:chromosome partitioning protein
MTAVKQYLKRVLLVLTQKGGVGKTTTVKNLAAALSLMKFKVLVIDWDPQANATAGLFEEEIPMERTIYNLIDPSIKSSEVPNYKDFIKTYEKGEVKFDVLPSGNNLALAEFALPAQTGREFYFRNRILSKIEGYDFILVDCQPSLGILVTNALCSSNDNELIVCVRADSDSRQSIGFLFDSISSLNESLQVMPKNFKILATQLIDEQKSDRFNLNKLEKSFPDNMFKTTIGKDTKLAQARDVFLDIFSYAPKSRGATEYMKVAKEIVEGK